MKHCRGVINHVLCFITSALKHQLKLNIEDAIMRFGTIEWMELEYHSTLQLFLFGLRSAPLGLQISSVKKRYDSNDEMSLMNGKCIPLDIRTPLSNLFQ